MKYKIDYIDDKVILRDMKDFEPEHIFECGQAFRWKKEEDGSYTTVAYSKFLNVSRDGKDIVLYPTNKKDFEDIWYYYFDLETDYSEIKDILSEDKILKEASEYGHGIRILNQEPFETVISFIISANNQIPRIKKSVETIAKEYGDYIGEFKGEKYYSFPDAKTLSKVDVSDIREKARVGFRDQRIIDSSKMIDQGLVDLDEVFKLDRLSAQEELMKLPGVGPKVSDCALLFAFRKGDAFPVDTWVKRVMEHFYLKEETPVSRIGKIGHELFGSLAGYAQQYLFYYAREEEIGKQKKVK